MLCAPTPPQMTRSDRRRTAWPAALQRCLVFVLCVVKALAPVPQQPAPVPPPAPAVAAVNWASGALYGATAYASSTGHWVRPSRAALTQPEVYRVMMRAGAQAAFTAEPRFALDDDDVNTFWSSPGGEACALGQLPWPAICLFERQCT